MKLLHAGSIVMSLKLWIAQEKIQQNVHQDLRKSSKNKKLTYKKTNKISCAQNLHQSFKEQWYFNRGGFCYVIRATLFRIHIQNIRILNAHARLVWEPHN